MPTCAYISWIVRGMMMMNSAAPGAKKEVESLLKAIRLNMPTFGIIRPHSIRYTYKMDTD